MKKTLFIFIALLVLTTGVMFFSREYRIPVSDAPSSLPAAEVADPGNDLGKADEATFRPHDVYLTGVGRASSTVNARLEPDFKWISSKESPAPVAVSDTPPEVAQAERPVETPAKIGSRMMSADSHEVLADVAATLAQSGERDELLTLFAAIESAESAEVRDTLARSLQALHNREFGRELLEFLIRNVNDVMIADQARDALARNIAPADIALLAETITAPDRDPLLRSYLLQTISRINSHDAVDALAERCWNTEDNDVRDAAAQALGNIGTPEAVTALIGCIEEHGIAHLNDPVVKSLMVAANNDSRFLLQEEFMNATTQSFATPPPTLWPC